MTAENLSEPIRSRAVEDEGMGDKGSVRSVNLAQVLGGVVGAGSSNRVSGKVNTTVVVEEIREPLGFPNLPQTHEHHVGQGPISESSGRGPHSSRNKSKVIWGPPSLRT